MVWGCVTYDGVGCLHQIKETMDSLQYCAILEQSLLDSLKDLTHEPSSILFQQDGNSKHCASVTMQWFEKHNIKLLPWPSCSPDMNIIEHVWEELDCRVHSRSPHPCTIDELWAVLQQEWYGLDMTYIRKLYDSLPTCVDTLRHAQGFHTHQ